MSPSVNRLKVRDLHEDVLASLARRLLPDPSVEKPADPLNALPADQSTALSLLTEKVGVDLASVHSYGPERTKVLGLINSLLSRSALSGDRATGALNRLGARGYLRPSRYKLIYAGVFKELLTLGIRPAHVERALLAPDSFEHILPEHLGAPDFPATTFLAKRIAPSRGSQFVILVEALRENAQLIVRSAWRVPDDIVQMNGAAGLLSLLRLFAERFGLPLTVGTIVAAKFIAYKSVALKPGTDPQEAIRVEAPKGHAFIGRTLFRVRSTGFLEIALAYAIDATQYRSFWQDSNPSA